MSDTDANRPAGLGYEPADARVPAILRLGAVMVILIMLSALVSWVIFDLFFARAERADPKVSPLAVAPSAAPPEPRLVVNEPADLASVRAEEDAVLGSYDWIDEGAKRVRLPIDRAMELLAEEAARSRPQEGQPAR
jgi:hypothetical protein